MAITRFRLRSLEKMARNADSVLPVWWWIFTGTTKKFKKRAFFCPKNIAFKYSNIGVTSRFNACHTVIFSLMQKKLTMQEIENSFGSNICRCTGYRPILDAFKGFASDASSAMKKDIRDIEVIAREIFCFDCENWFFAVSELYSF